MAFDLILGRTVSDWSCGDFSDLPKSSRGYAPSSFWGVEEMEAKVAQFMSKPKGLFGLGGKPSRAEAVKMLVDFMRSHKIGPSGVSSGKVGSFLFPVKEQKRLYDKIDDVRFDIRGAKSTIGAGVFAAAGALALLGIASIYRTARKS